MVPRRLGKSGLFVSPIGFGAFKIGRNEGAKYAQRYALQSDDEVRRLLRGVLELGVNLFDTAPAYGTSEERIGELLPRTANDGIVISSKVGETFENGRSTFDFSERATRASVLLSRKRLGVGVLDVVLVHSDGNDMTVLNDTDVVATLKALRAEGMIRLIGFSGKTPAGAEAALGWADVIMVEYTIEDRSHEAVIAAAAKRGVGVLVKKGLASGRLDACASIRFVLANPGVSSLVIGGLDLAHVSANVRCVEESPGGAGG